MKPIITAIIKDKKGRVLSIGQNSYSKTHPLMRVYGKKVGILYKDYIHAEIASIVKCSNLNKAHSIHVFRYSRDGRAMNAKPCLICQSAIAAAGIKHVYWSVSE